MSQVNGDHRPPYQVFPDLSPEGQSEGQSASVHHFREMMNWAAESGTGPLLAIGPVPLPSHHALFGALFSSVGGILARLFPPQSGPCPASRRPAATPTAPRRVRHTRRPRPPRFARRSCCRSRSLEPVVDSALGSVPLGQLVPLAAAAQPEDDRIQHFPPIGDLPPSRFLGPEFQEDRLDPPPQLVGDFPDRTQRFASRLSADHGSVSCRCARKWSLLATSSFLQKVFRRFSDSYLAGKSAKHGSGSENDRRDLKTASDAQDDCGSSSCVRSVRDRLEAIRTLCDTN